MSDVPGDNSHTGVEYGIQPGRGRVEMGSLINNIARGSVAHITITTWKATMLPQAAFGHLWMANRFLDGPYRDVAQTHLSNAPPQMCSNLSI